MSHPAQPSFLDSSQSGTTPMTVLFVCDHIVPSRFMKKMKFYYHALDDTSSNEMKGRKEAILF